MQWPLQLAGPAGRAHLCREQAEVDILHVCAEEWRWPDVHYFIMELWED
jgi:hypothetical protein